MQNKSKGFTLIELLVVVLIIGILAAIALPMYTKTVEKSRAVNAAVWLKTAADSIQRLYMENPAFDACLGSVDICGDTENWSVLDIQVVEEMKGFTCNIANECVSDFCLQTPMCASAKDYVIYSDVYNDGTVRGPYCVGAQTTESSEDMCKMLGYTVKATQNYDDKVAVGASNISSWVNKEPIGDSAYSFAKP